MFSQHHAFGPEFGGELFLLFRTDAIVISNFIPGNTTHDISVGLFGFSTRMGCNMTHFDKPLIHQKLFPMLLEILQRFLICNYQLGCMLCQNGIRQKVLQELVPDAIDLSSITLRLVQCELGGVSSDDSGAEPLLLMTRNGIERILAEKLMWNSF